MSIQVICPNGHFLTVPESFAGRMGLCPVCKAPVKVPLADTRPITEATVVGVLQERSRETAGSIDSENVDRGEAGGETEKTRARRCPLCNREVGDLLVQCPFCHSHLSAQSSTR